MLVLSIFPGLGLLDMAFEEHGFTVVRGPDLLWGGDIKTFHPPAGRFDGVIGGPPCQAHSSYAAMNAAQKNRIADDLVPEFIRVVMESQPDWWVMENSPGVPNITISGYHHSRPLVVNNRDFGAEQSRVRKWQFGFKRFAGDVHVETVALHNPMCEPPCLASEGIAGRISHRRSNGKVKSKYEGRRPFDRFCDLQGLPQGFGDNLPFTVRHKYQAVGNGVPLPMGRAIARGVAQFLQERQ